MDPQDERRTAWRESTPPGRFFVDMIEPWCYGVDDGGRRWLTWGEYRAGKPCAACGKLIDYGWYCPPQHNEPELYVCCRHVWFDPGPPRCLCGHDEPHREMTPEELREVSVCKWTVGDHSPA